MERCILCDGSSLKNKKTVIVKEGLRTIVLVSQHVKNDGLAKRICDLSQLEVHVACRNKYTHHIDLVSLKTFPLSYSDELGIACHGHRYFYRKI